MKIVTVMSVGVALVGFAGVAYADPPLDRGISCVDAGPADADPKNLGQDLKYLRENGIIPGTAAPNFGHYVVDTGDQPARFLSKCTTPGEGPGAEPN